MCVRVCVSDLGLEYCVEVVNGVSFTFINEYIKVVLAVCINQFINHKSSEGEM